MSITNRTFDIGHDLSESLALADASGLNFPHIADWGYRFSSWALDVPENGHVWLNGDAKIIGWVVMQTPFWAIDCIAGTNAPSSLYAEMIEWAVNRARDMSREKIGRPMWFLSIGAHRGKERSTLEASGLEDVSDVGEDSWSKVILELTDESRLEPVKLPAGLTIRSLNVQNELQKYVDLHREVFASESMTIRWRERTTLLPEYQNVLDLVVVDDHGDLQGFCVGWLRRLVSGEIVGQVEPMGVRQKQRGKRLSRQLMTTAIKLFRELGAKRVFVETDVQRIEAMAAYRATGYSVLHDVLVYKHTVPQT